MIVYIRVCEDCEKVLSRKVGKEPVAVGAIYCATCWSVRKLTNPPSAERKFQGESTGVWFFFDSNTWEGSEKIRSEYNPAVGESR